MAGVRPVINVDADESKPEPTARSKPPGVTPKRPPTQASKPPLGPRTSGPLSPTSPRPGGPYAFGRRRFGETLLLYLYQIN